MRIIDFGYRLAMNGDLFNKNGRKIKPIIKGGKKYYHLYGGKTQKTVSLDSLLSVYYPKWQPTSELQALIDEALDKGLLTPNDVKETFDI